tara:strand:- start:1025 stop:1375 length:351 start_codon:yes stop_codon:yes gene_type:complete
MGTADNTVFCYASKHCDLSDPCIKVSNCGDNDFFVSDLNEVTAQSSIDQYDKIKDMMINSLKSDPINFDVSGRDGMFNDDQMFAIYDTDDLLNMIDRLAKCLPKEVIEALACMEAE